MSVVDISGIGGDSNGPILIDQLFCSGLETSVFDCDYNTVHMCTHQQDIGIICQRKRIIVFMKLNFRKNFVILGLLFEDVVLCVR